MTSIRNLVLAGATALAAAQGTAVTGAAAQARSDLVIGLRLEPPHLDPTSAAAGAIDQVLYANVFEGLTRFRQDGSVGPGLAERVRRPLRVLEGAPQPVGVTGRMLA